MTIVITGAGGFVGSHLARYMLEQGNIVYAIDKKEPALTSIVNDENYYWIDSGLDDVGRLKKLLPDKPDAVLHFAWAGVAPEKRSSIDIQKPNVDLTLKAVELASLLGAKKFIFPGSTFEYSFSNRIINRCAPPSPQDAYGTAKISSKYFAEVMCRQKQIPFIYAVLSSIYSADRLDNNVITYTIKTLLKGEKPSLTSLEQLWDYIHIDDVCRAMELIVESGKNGGFYVVGHGDNCPLSDYIYQIRDLIDPNLPLGIGEVPYSDSKVPMSCVDLSEMQKDTGFKPAVSFKKGVSEMIEKLKYPGGGV